MRNFLLGLFVGSIGVALGAPFNATVTRRADLASVDDLCIKKLDDGGVGYRPVLTVPSIHTLPDAGTKTIQDRIPAGPCEITNATVRTNVLSFMSNQALMCGRVTADLEQ
jgi:hypothetical protein